MDSSGAGPRAAGQEAAGRIEETLLGGERRYTRVQVSEATGVDRDRAQQLWMALGFAAVGAIYALWERQFRRARFCAAAQTTLILWGWGAAHYPYLVAPDVTIYNSAAPVITLRLVWWALLAGSALLFPSLYYLFRVFKGGRAI